MPKAKAKAAPSTAARRPWSKDDIRTLKSFVARERAGDRPATRTDGWRHIPAGGQAERASRDGEAARQEDGPESGAESGQETITATRYTMAVAAGLPRDRRKNAPSGPAIIAQPPAAADP
jgi:hypothetical protein